MRIPFHFSEQLKYARKKVQMSKSEVAHATGIDRRRIQEYESNRRKPTDLNIHRLSRFFNMNLRVDWTARRQFGVEAIVDPHSIFRPKQDRPFRVRLASSRRQAPRRTKDLESKLCERKDLNRVLDVLVEFALESYLELIVVLQLLTDHAQVGYLSPASQAYHGPKIIDPTSRANVGGKRFPVIGWRDSLWFPQVTFHTSPTIRVDFLVCSQSSCGPRWTVVEVDGLGHQPDESRETLPFDVLRLNTSTVLDPKLPSTLADQYKNVSKAS